MQPFTMLIEFDVPPEHQTELVARLSTQIGETLPGVEGFISARVQASVDRHTVINYARWTSRAAWEAATGLDAANTGHLHDKNWAESQQQTWFGSTADHNPVATLLAELGASTRGVTAFDQSREVTA